MREMEVYELDIVRKFKCLNSDCKDSCCYGWQIALDEETAERYKEVPGLYGRHLRGRLKKTDPPVFRRVFGACPFLNCDKLCQFQQNGEEELMPRVCRYFPRHVVKMGDRMESTLLLSCPPAARLLVDNPGRMELRRLSEDDAAQVEPFWIIENEDVDFRDFLLAERDRLLDILWDEKDPRPLPEIFQAFYAYVHAQHDPLMLDDREAMAKVVFSWDKGEQGRYALVNEPTFAFFKLKTLDRMILNHIDYGYIQIREPKLYYFVRKYLKKFSSMTVDGADRYFDEKLRYLTREYPFYEARYRSYFSYLLQQLYPVAYENYFMLRQILFAFLYTELLQLFDLIEFENTGKVLSEERAAEIIVILEKGVRHNPTQTDNLLRVLRQEFL